MFVYTDFLFPIVTTSILSLLEDSLSVVTKRIEKPVLASFLKSRVPRSRELTTLSLVLSNNRQKHYLALLLNLNLRIRSS